MPPARSAVPICGRTTHQEVWKPLAPRSIEASMRLPESRRNRAIALLYTTTMQNVAWPSTIVHIEKSRPMMSKAERSDMPVMMAGSAIGRMKSSEMVLLPKKRARDKGAGASVRESRAEEDARRPPFSGEEIGREG